MIIEILFEDKATDYVKKMIREYASPIFRPYLNTIVSDLPNDLKDKLIEYNPTLFNKCLENGANLTMFLRLDFLQYFDIRHGKGPVKFIIGLARIGIGELGFFSTAYDITEISLLKQLVLFAYNNEEVNKSLDSNLNGMTFYELKAELNAKRKEFNKNNRIALSNNITNNSNYKVIAINSKKQAEKYGNYTEWCITHGSYSSYAKYGARFYFCLKDGFENVKKVKGENCPLDEYGLSMISVLIDIDGEPTIITTRWNHENDGENNENLCTAEQLQNITGILFYETFKPYTKEELHKKGIISFDEAKERLEAGEQPANIFDLVEQHDNYAVVKLNEKWNFIDASNHLISEKWFKGVCNFYEGFASVNLNDKHNFIDASGNYLSKTWFDMAYDFNDGYASIELEGKDNFIDTSGNYLSKTWFDRTYRFEDGYGLVKLNNKYNFIDASSNYLSETWFDNTYGFRGGIASIELNKRYNFIDTSGNYLSETWFDDTQHYFSNGYGWVELHRKYNFIGKDGKLISEIWFDVVVNEFNFSGTATVMLKHKLYDIDKQGNLSRR